jgi:hypothetical protein
VLGRLEAEVEVDGVRLAEGEPGGALQVESRGRRLVQLGGGGRELLERHLRPPGLEEEVLLARRVERLAVEDVLEVQPGDGGDEQVRWLGLVDEAPQAVVPGPVLAVGVVVADDRGQVADGEGVVGHRSSSRPPG